MLPLAMYRLVKEISASINLHWRVIEIKRTLNRYHRCFFRKPLLVQYNFRVEKELCIIISSEDLNPNKLYKANNQVWLTVDEKSQ